MTYTRNRRDSNEPDIVAYFKGIGCWLVQGKPGQGFDYLVLFRGTIFVVEIKMAGRSLTTYEKTLMHECELRGIQYSVIRSVEDAQAMVEGSIK
jgi:hypothetical protein